MNRKQNIKENAMRKIISVFLLAAAVITGASAATAQAASVTAVATADISADSSTGSSVALPAITIAEQAAGDIAEGAFVLSLPAGFAFDASSIANVAATGAGLAASSTVSFTDAGHAAVTVTATSTEAGSITVGSVVPLKVKAAAGTPLAAGNITLSSGAIAGLAATTSLGTLTEISGAPAKLAFTAQPSASVQVGSVFSTSTVAVKDQFGNTVTSDNGRAIGLTVIPVSPATTTGALGGNTSASTASGTAIFGNLTFSVPGVIQLQANASGLASV
ncbi:MAG TPA: hypothetical protein VHA30_04015, partial [Patescibacteria group bacterium]|nr:hypothetical protein [Patescibacteria group bacterium]